MAGHIDLPTRGLTFRVRGVPLDWDIDRLKSLLADKVGPAGPIISSLALEIHGRSRTATVSFQTPPTRDFLLIPLGEAPNPLTGPQSLSLDDGFFGITTLFVPPSQDHKVEYVAQTTFNLPTVYSPVQHHRHFRPRRTCIRLLQTARWRTHVVTRCSPAPHHTGRRPKALCTRHDLWLRLESATESKYTDPRRPCNLLPQ